MGTPMVRRLLAAGFSVVVHNRDRSKADPLVAAGASAVDSPRALGKAAAGGLVLVNVSDAAAFRAVVFGRGGVAAGSAPGTLVVNLGTIAPEEARRFAERLAGRSLRYLEAPVGGSRDAAAAGELLVFAGGEAADLARAQPVLTHLAQRIELVGPVGAGSAMKLVNNLVTLATVALDAEALALAEAFGLDPVRTVDLLLAGGGASRMLARKREAFLRGDYAVQFKLALAAKDLRLVRRAARDVGASALLAREAQRLADEGLRAGDGDRDFSVLLEAARRRRAAGTGSAGPPPERPA